MENLNQYEVVYLNMQQFLIESENQGPTKYLEQEVLEEVREEYEEVLKMRNGGSAPGLASVLRKIYSRT